MVKENNLWAKYEAAWENSLHKLQDPQKADIVYLVPQRLFQQANV